VAAESRSKVSLTPGRSTFPGLVKRGCDGGAGTTAGRAPVKLMRRMRETGLVTPERIGGHRRPVLEPHQDLLRAMVEDTSGITLAEI